MISDRLKFLFSVLCSLFLLLCKAPDWVHSSGESEPNMARLIGFNNIRSYEIGQSQLYSSEEQLWLANFITTDIIKPN